MTRKAISIYMAATCAIVIVCPGRLVCGIVIALELCILMLFGLLFRTLLSKLRMENMMQSTMLVFVVFLTLLYKQILCLLMPELALQMSFIIFLPSISTFTTVFLLEEDVPSMSVIIKNDMVSAGLFACYVIVISLIRDVLGFGTLTLPYYGKQIELVLFKSENISALTFLATIPGAIVLTALFLSGFIYVEKKFNIIRKAGVK